VNGAADMGGMHGFGAIRREEDEPVFHAAWERQAVGLQVALEAQGVCSTDEHRFEIERLRPDRYLTAAYYERWLLGTEAILEHHGIATAAELAAHRESVRRDPAAPLPQRTDERLGEDIDRLIREGGTKRRPEADGPRFAVWDAVRGRNAHPAGHTRIPRYARGRLGVVVADYGAYAFADTLAANAGEHPQHLYAVRFEGAELWGPDAEPGTVVYLDLFESYLEAA
jgi:nitrile hydratase